MGGARFLLFLDRFHQKSSKKKAKTGKTPRTPPPPENQLFPKNCLGETHRDIAYMRQADKIEARGRLERVRHLARGSGKSKLTGRRFSLRNAIVCVGRVVDRRVCGRAQFLLFWTNSIEKTAKKSKKREKPDTHALFTTQKPITPHRKRIVLGPHIAMRKRMNNDCS